MRKISSEPYEILFGEATREEQLDAAWHKDIANYRTKTYTSGPIRECAIFPIWNTAKQSNQAKEQLKRATPEQRRKHNDTQARKRLIRKINANFGEKDLCLTLTYKGPPPDYETAYKDIRRYIRRIRAYRRKHGLPELKYVYVIEYSEDPTAKRRIHHHVIMSGMDRDEAERIWEKGWANCRRLQPDAFALTALANYIIKDPKGKKRWSCSTNLIPPKETSSETKISLRKVDELVRDMEANARRIFEKAYPGYESRAAHT